MKTLSLVIPVYFNEKSLPKLFEALDVLRTSLLEIQLILEVIFVDDGSQDNSYQLIAAYQHTQKQVKVIKLTRNFGAVHASKAAYQYISGECFMVIAADLQDPPNIIVDMAKAWQAGHKLVICTRQHRHDPLITKAYAKLYYALLRKMVIKSYPKNGFDMFLLDSQYLPVLRDSAKNINPNVLAYWLGITPYEIPYVRQKRLYGKSRWTFTKKLTFFIDSILGFSIIPIRIISAVGIIVASLSFLYGLWMIIGRFIFPSIQPGFTSTIVLLSFLLGIVIFMLGVIGEYLWRIYDEVSAKPEYVIEKILE